MTTSSSTKTPRKEQSITTTLLRGDGRAPTSVPAFLAFAIGATAACSNEPELVVSFEPKGSFEVTALPYDPEFLLDSLATVFPRPTFPEIQMEIANYELPNAEGMDSILGVLAYSRDSVQSASDALFQLDPATAEYRTQYDEFRELYSRFIAVSRQTERTTRRLLGSDRELARRVETAADSIRAWEELALSNLDSSMTSLTGDSALISTVTDEDGEGTISLTRGRWWIVARMPHPTNPFLEYFWNRPIRVSRWRSSYRLPLSLDNALIRWRH